MCIEIISLPRDSIEQLSNLHTIIYAYSNPLLITCWAALFLRILSNQSACFWHTYFWTILVVLGSILTLHNILIIKGSLLWAARYNGISLSSVLWRVLAPCCKRVSTASFICTKNGYIKIIHATTSGSSPVLTRGCLERRGIKNRDFGNVEQFYDLWKTVAACHEPMTTSYKLTYLCSFMFRLPI